VLRSGGWPAPFGITLVADLLAAIMVLLTGVTGLAVAVYSLGSIDERREGHGFHVLYQVLLAGVCGSFLTGDLFNLEATPAESTSYRLAKHDRVAFPDIITSGDGEPFYTNSSQLPVDYTEDIFDALDLQDDLQTKYTGGTVFHGFLGEAIDDWQSCARLVKSIATNYRLPYFTISPTFSVCPVHGYLAGEHFNCPKCADERRTEIRMEMQALKKEQAELQDSPTAVK
jgi:hypothetical protein